MEGGQARPPGGVWRRRRREAGIAAGSRPSRGPSCARSPCMPAACGFLTAASAVRGGVTPVADRMARARPTAGARRLAGAGTAQAPEPRRRRPAISPRGVLRIDPSSTAVQPPLFLGGARRSWPWEICRGPCGRMPLLVICRVAQGRPQPAQGRTWERRDVRPPRGAAVHLHRSTPSTAPSRNASHATHCEPTDTRRAGACGRDDSGLRRGCHGVPAGS